MTKEQAQWAIKAIEEHMTDLYEWNGEVPELIAHPATLYDLKIALGLAEGWCGHGPPREWELRVGGVPIVADENCQGGIIRLGGRRRPVI